MHVRKLRHRDLVSRAIAGAAVLISAYLLKSFYSQASSEDLTWIIGPTAWLTEIFSNLSFNHEPGYGWVDVKHNAVIAPACAGVNFLIISFCMSSFQILWMKRSPKKLITGIITAGLISYAATIIANTARITLSVALFKTDIYFDWLTPGMLHRVNGTVIYYLFLCICSYIINYRLTSSDSENPTSTTCVTGRKLILVVPLFWYLLFSLGVPFANNAWKNNPEQFITHALSVGLITSALTLISFKAQYLYIRVNNALDKHKSQRQGAIQSE